MSTPDERGKVFDYVIGLDPTSADGDITSLFTRLKRVIPDAQDLIFAAADTPVRSALQRMRSFRISQLPVLHGERVLGIFSYRSFTEKLVEMAPRCPADPSMAPIVDFTEPPAYLSAEDDVTSAIEQFDRHDVVLIGDREHLQALVTPVDALRFFYGVSCPYVIVAEIEVAIRALIRRQASEALVAECIARSVRAPDRPPKLPETLDQMTFNDYVQLITHRENWPVFGNAFGYEVPYIRTRLDGLRKLRNDIFHVKRPLLDGDLRRLRTEREWLHARAEYLDARRGR